MQRDIVLGAVDHFNLGRSKTEQTIIRIGGKDIVLFPYGQSPSPSVALDGA